MKSPNIFAEYAKAYQCSIAEAIADRDAPMTLEDCVEAFTEASGRAPSSEEIEIMHPESSAYVFRWIREQEF